MKKYTSVLILVFLSLFLLSACSFPLGETKPKPFEKGVLISSSYYNFQANIKFIVPIGWDAKIGEEDQAYDTNAADQSESDIDEAKMKYAFMDFSCSNPNTGSYMIIAYAPINKFKDFDDMINQSIEYVIEASELKGLTFDHSDSFTETIAGRECRIEELTTTYSGVDILEYVCFIKIDSYACILIIVPNDIADATETFDSIIANFSAIE